MLLAKGDRAATEGAAMGTTSLLRDCVRVAWRLRAILTAR